MSSSSRTFRLWSARLLALIRGIAARGIVRLVYSEPKLQRLQVGVLASQLLELDHAESYGLTARPRPGAEAVVLFPLASRAQGVVIATPDRRYRLTILEEGEVALYDDLGQVVHLKRDRVLVKSPTRVRVEAPLVEVAGATKVELVAPLVAITGNVTVTGSVVAAGGISSGGAAVAGQVSDALGALGALRSAYNVHTHPESVGTVTGPPTPTA